MRTIAEENRLMTGSRYLGPGRVLEIDDVTSRAHVFLDEAPDQEPVWAHIGLAGPGEVACGDTVLIIGENSENMYIVGLLARNEDLAAQNRITLENGAYAQTSGTGEAEKLQVFSDKHTLVFEYDASQKKARVNIESGDLEFVVPNGDIAFKSSREIHFQGHSIEMQSRSHVRLKIINTLGKILSSLVVQSRRMKLQTPELHVTSQYGAFQIKQTEYSGQSLQGQISNIKLIARKVETLAQTVITKSKNVYKTVEELTQLCTGRLRTLVRSTYHMKSKNTYMNTAEDFKIKADKIHLG